MEFPDANTELNSLIIGTNCKIVDIKNITMSTQISEEELIMT